MAIRPETRARLDDLVQRRIASNAEQIRHSLHQISIGNPLGAEPSEERAVQRLEAKLENVAPDPDKSRAAAEWFAAGIRTTSAMREAAEAAGRGAGDGREAIWGKTFDFLDVSFLDRGVVAADAVARIAFRDGRAQGSGLLVAPALLLTNHHVIDSPSAAAELCAELRYERNASARGARASFAFDAERCFVTDTTDGLDFTLVHIGRALEGDLPIGRFPWLPLSDAPDKHMLGEVANIIQHPQGRYKELVLRENQLVARDELARVLHYVADTEPGSSGSPVFNNEWQVIALHHWGGPWLEQRDAAGPRREINEGIRISEIVKFLRGAVPGLRGSHGESVREALRLWDAGDAARPNGSTVVSIPGRKENRVTSEARRVEDFSDRGGYEPGFLRTISLPLPGLAARHTPARNLKALIGEDPHELRYHHFSIVMNAERRLAYFTACNIDGSRTVAVVRKDKRVIEDPTLADLGVESLDGGAEASDAFRPDPRIATEEQMARPFYEEQRVPGFPVATDSGRIARMFQKGHIIMRGDPAWGQTDEALAAERDTFFYTNAAPQVGFFNQGSPLNRPGSKGKLRWRAVETYVLRNAYATKQRVTVFAGPIFKRDDPEYRFGSRIPMQFWKIVCWVQDGELRSIALVANQATVLTVMPEALAAPEAFEDEEELARVRDFLSTVAHVEKETGLDFGDEVRNADVRRGRREREDAATAELPAAMRRTGGGRTAAGRSRRATRKRAARKRARKASRKRAASRRPA
jgi:endonuclease G